MQIGNCQNPRQFRMVQVQGPRVLQPLENPQNSIRSIQNLSDPWIPQQLAQSRPPLPSRQQVDPMCHHLSDLRVREHQAKLQVAVGSSRAFSTLNRPHNAGSSFDRNANPCLFSHTKRNFSSILKNIKCASLLDYLTSTFASVQSYFIILTSYIFLPFNSKFT